MHRFLSHATYGGSWHDTAPTPSTPWGRLGTGGEMWTLQTMSEVGAKVIGLPKFSAGIKGGFEPPLLSLNESAAKGLNCTARISPFGALPEGCFGT